MRAQRQECLLAEEEYRDQGFKHNQPNPENHSPKMKVFITGLSAQMTRRGLLYYFKSLYPSTAHFSAQFIAKKKKIPGFGFLVLRSKGDVEAVLKRRLFYYKGRYLKAEPCHKNEGLEKFKEDLERRRVFVGRIPDSMTSEDLWAVLEEELGPIESAYVVSGSKNTKKRHKGFGNAIFKSEESAKRGLMLGRVFVSDFMTEINIEKAKGKKGKKNKNNQRKLSHENWVKQTMSINCRRGGQKERKESETESEYFQKKPQKSPSNNKIHKKRGSGIDPSQRITKGIPIPVTKIIRETELEDLSKKITENLKQKTQRVGKKIHYHRQNSQNQEIGNKRQKLRKAHRMVFKSQFENLNQQRKSSKVSALVHDPPPKRSYGRRNQQAAQKGTQIEHLLDSKGWKKYTLKSLNHSRYNLRVNFGKTSQNQKMIF